MSSTLLAALSRQYYVDGAAALYGSRSLAAHARTSRSGRGAVTVACVGGLYSAQASIATAQNCSVILALRGRTLTGLSRQRAPSSGSFWLREEQI